MRTIDSHRSTTVFAGVFLVALLASADIFAADLVAPVDAAQPVAGARAPARSVPTTSARVYLDDYQRIPQMVTKQYPTKTYWIGAKRAQSKAQTKAPG
jgi:hypothetical protein